MYRISGIAASGLLMLLAGPAIRMDVIRALQQTEGQVVKCFLASTGQ